VGCIQKNVSLDFQFPTNENHLVFLPVALLGLVVKKPVTVKSVCIETYPVYLTVLSCLKLKVLCSPCVVLVVYLNTYLSSE
jgi:hypothetical protein